jgi:acetyltransferase-like isoleucine patch superfamily enzyme
MTPKRLMLAPALLVLRCLRPFSRLRRIWALAALQDRLQTRVPDSVLILGAPEVHGTGNIHCGEALFLFRDLYLETQGSGRIEIGDRVVMSRGVHLVAFASIRIGAGTMIGEYTSIRDANHRFSEDVSIRESGYTAKPIEIGANVWIGRGATVLAGVRIGDNAVVGANAVVTRDVPAGAVAVGVPARPISTDTVTRRRA